MPPLLLVLAHDKDVKGRDVLGGRIDGVFEHDDATFGLSIVADVSDAVAVIQALELKECCLCLEQLVLIVVP